MFEQISVNESFSFIQLEYIGFSVFINTIREKTDTSLSKQKEYNSVALLTSYSNKASKSN